jgi:hypothetical protein
MFFSSVGRDTWLMVVVIFLVGVFLRTALPLCSSQDSLIWRYSAIGKDIAEGGSMERFSSQPSGYPTMLSLAFSIFGASYLSVIAFNVFLSSLTLILVFLISYTITKNELASLFSMIFLTFFPMSINYSQFGATEITSVFFFSLTVLLLLLSLECRSNKMFMLVAASVSLASYIRLENIFILSALAAISYAILMRNRNDLKKLIYPIVLFAALSFPLSFFILQGSSTFGPYPEQFPPDFDWNYYKEPFSIKYLPENIIFETGRITQNVFYPAILYLFMFLPILFLKKYPRSTVPLLWVVLSLLFFGRFWALKYVSPDLYLTNLHPAFAILFGIGSVTAAFFLYEKLGRKSKMFYFALFMVLLLITLYSNVEIISNMRFERDTCFPKEILASGPLMNGCIIVEETANGTDNLNKVVKFILPNNDIKSNTTNCESGYFLKLNGTRYKTVFGEPIQNITFEKCKTSQVSGSFKLIYILKFDCST